MLAASTDAASLWLFRRVFGSVCVILVVRYFAHDWIGHYFVEPKYFFSFFDWWRPLPGRGMYVEFAVMGVAALLLALDRWPRVAAAIFAVLFTHQHFCDKAIYLNHYYFIAQVGFLFALLPVGGRAGRAGGEPPIAAGWLWLFRAQVGLVYFYGGIGKLNSDWLLRAEPLRTWLHTSGDTPLIGWLVDRPAVAYFFSWAGAIFDLTIPAFLLWRKTRAPAYVVVVAFHVITGLLFPIGLFPWLMPLAATLFFDPSWPRRFFGGTVRLDEVPRPTPKPLVVLLALHLGVQTLLPLRSWFYPGDVNWTEQGFRFSWKVMLIDKVGVVDYRVVTQSGRVFLVNPRTLLTPLQTRMFATQPDMIEQLAHHLATEYAAQTGEPVQVFATATVAYNGRPPRLLVSPDRPLSRAAPPK